MLVAEIARVTLERLRIFLFVPVKRGTDKIQEELFKVKENFR